ncbi:MAG: hypothetical protein PHZ13_04425 [bacterium]|jgi:hypothetical protein|nr:hypothetical protein [bacterium]
MFVVTAITKTSRMILFPKHLSVLDKEYTFGIARDIRFENRGGECGEGRPLSGAVVHIAQQKTGQMK